MTKRSRLERTWRHVQLTSTRYTIGTEQITIDKDGVLQLTATKERALRQALHKNPRIVLLTPTAQLSSKPQSVFSTSPEDQELQAQLSEALGGNDAVVMNDKLYIVFDQEDVITRDGKVYALFCTREEAQTALERRKTREAAEEPPAKKTTRRKPAAKKTPAKEAPKEELAKEVPEVKASEPEVVEETAKELEVETKQAPETEKASAAEETTPATEETEKAAEEKPVRKPRRRAQKKA